jgi:antitoxin (DNA-binding transcriptional repressor) of toxin-antitoxin stability system
MTTVSIEDLELDFPRLQALLSQGEEFQISMENAVVARVVPEKTTASTAPVAQKPRVIPDFMARLKEIYGDRILEPTGAEIVRMDRDRY